MTKSHKKVFDDLSLSPVITSMAQEKIFVVMKVKDTNPVANLFHISQWSAFPFSVQDTLTPAYGCRLSDILYL